MECGVRILAFVLGFIAAQAGATADNNGRRLALDSRHLLIDGSLTDEEAAARPFTFNSFQEAVRYLGDTCTMYLAPYVYWVDNPDSPVVAVGRDGREPFGMVIKARRLTLVGLDKDARNTVLASQRGQTQGAVGNFTMFDFHVDRLTVENLTMGNYCNVDLDYKLRPELSRKKRNEAITQAHVGYVHGDSLVARNVRFISRLNLNPLTGARHSYYEDCHFECTDDAMNGNAVYRHCTVDLYGEKPFWSTYGHGAMFTDCDFYVKGHNRTMYFMKQGGPLALIDCRYHAPSDSIYIGWTAYPQRWLRCYQQNFTLNGRPYTIGNHQPANTVTLSGFKDDEPPFLALDPHTATLMTGRDTLRLQAANANWRLQPGYERYAQLNVEGDVATVIATNTTDDTATFCIEAGTADGRQAACELTVLPSQLPPPAFVRKPRIVVKGDTARLDYELDLQGRRDMSMITWRRNGRVVSVSHDAPQRTYVLTEADRGCQLEASIEPRHQRSTAAMPVTAVTKVKKGRRIQRMDTDFHDFPCDWQPEVAEGYWTVDGYKPADTAEFPWTVNREKPMWEYGEGFNGAVGRGLLQTQKGARIMFTPMQRPYGDMTLTLNVDPTKTAGQGFGSATGQYMDICLKFDPRTLTGYGLRIVRTTKHAKAVDFLLVEYDNGQVRPISEAVSSTCYRTGCTIKLQTKGSQLTAHVETATPKPLDSTLPHVVDLSATVAPNSFGGIHIQHTGSCGESTTMLHRMQVWW